jgi:hypothetical protein
MNAASGAFDHPFRMARGRRSPCPGTIFRTAKKPENDQDQPDQKQVLHGLNGMYDSPKHTRSGPDRSRLIESPTSFLAVLTAAIFPRHFRLRALSGIFHMRLLNRHGFKQLRALTRARHSREGLESSAFSPAEWLPIKERRRVAPKVMLLDSRLHGNDGVKNSA